MSVVSSWPRTPLVEFADLRDPELAAVGRHEKASAGVVLPVDMHEERRLRPGQQRHVVIGCVVSGADASNGTSLPENRRVNVAVAAVVDLPFTSCR